MSIRINDTAPDFTAPSTAGQLKLHEWIGDGYAILFSHPKDFTPVCTTEFGAVAQLAEFAKRNTKVMGVSVNNVEEHKKWKRDIETAGAPADFPIIDDTSLHVSKLFDVLQGRCLPARWPHTGGQRHCARGIHHRPGREEGAPDHVDYPMSVVSNFAEILRALDAVQATDGVPIATPANWMPGQDVIVALSLNDAQAEEKSGAIDVKLPYLLRITKAPKK